MVALALVPYLALSSAMQPLQPLQQVSTADGRPPSSGL